MQQDAVAALDGRVGSERALAREARAELHAPRTGGAGEDVLAQLVDERTAPAPQQRNELAAARARLPVSRLDLRAGHPVLGSAAGHRANVALRFSRQGCASREPVAHAPRAGIVGGRRQPQVAEGDTQLTQEFRRLRQRLHRIKRVVELPLVCGTGHELRDAECTRAAAGRRADRVRPEIAFTPDHSDEVFERQIVGGGGRFQHQADRLRGRIPIRFGACAPAVLCGAGAREQERQYCCCSDEKLHPSRARRTGEA